MSRAFVKDDGGWQYCQLKMDSCLYADENGCVLDSCRFGLIDPQQEAKQPQNEE